MSFISMMTLTLLTAMQAAAETVTGENPVLTPVASGEPEMNLFDMACNFIFSSNALRLFVRLERKIRFLWNVSAII